MPGRLHHAHQTLRVGEPGEGVGDLLGWDLLARLLLVLVEDLVLRPDHQDAAERQAIFETNLAKILAHNQDEQWTYKMGVNQFTDMTAKEFKAYYHDYSKDHMFADSKDLSAVPDVCGGPKASNASFCLPQAL